MKWDVKKQLVKGRLVSSYLRHKLFPKLTYAQGQEDLVSQYLLGDIRKFIDIGANDGISGSNTFLFALKGARGLCFEPVSSTFFRLRWLYYLNRNIKCISEGISNENKYLHIQSDNVLSFIPETQDSVHKKLLQPYFSDNAHLETVSVRPLNYWLHRYDNFRDCDIVSVDVEGHEWLVLQGIDFSNFRTKCFIIETHALNTEWVHQHYQDIDNMLNKNGYQALLKNTFNTFWCFENAVSKENLMKVVSDFSDYILA